jgi:nucleotide-binding universal stress UspA family protein
MAKILLATDGSEAALRAADLAGMLAQRTGWAVEMLYAPWMPGPVRYQRLWGPYNPYNPVFVQHLLDEDAERVLNATQRRLDVYGIQAERLVRSAAFEGPAIARAAEERGATLIILGTHGRRGIMGRLLGSVSEAVVRYAACPVILVRSDAVFGNETLGHILLASDGSDSTLAAARALIPLAQALGAHVTVAHVTWLGLVEQSDLIPPEGLTDIAPTQLLGVPGLHEALDRPAELLHRAGIPVHTHVRNARHTAEALEQIAANLGAGLIVVGSRRLGELAGRLLGSVAADLLAQARRPVMIARAHAVEGAQSGQIMHTEESAAQPTHQAQPSGANRLPQVRLVIHATDGSAASWSAARYAVALARYTGARLVALFVVNTREARRLAPLEHEALAAMREQGESAVAHVVNLAHQHGVPAQGMLVDGVPGQAIVDAAADLGADLIVVGSHGATGLERVLLGSVSEFVVRHARCPVLVAPSHQRQRLP